MFCASVNGLMFKETLDDRVSEGEGVGGSFLLILDLNKLLVLS